MSLASDDDFHSANNGRTSGLYVALRNICVRKFRQFSTTWYIACWLPTEFARCTCFVVHGHESHASTPLCRTCFTRKLELHLTRVVERTPAAVTNRQRRKSSCMSGPNPLLVYTNCQPRCSAHQLCLRARGDADSKP